MACVKSLFIFSNADTQLEIPVILVLLRWSWFYGVFQWL